MRHIRRPVLTVLRYEAVGAYHVVTVWLQVAGQPVRYLFPLSGGDVHVLVLHAALRLGVAIFIDTPVQRSLEVVYLLDGRQFR